MKTALVLGIAALASCARAPRPAPAKPAAPIVAAPSADAGIEAGDPLPSLDTLAERALASAPGMREVARADDATRAVVTAATDGCFRAIIATTGPARARFEDATHAPRGAELSGTDGLVPPGGPACARKGETLRLVVEPTDVPMRAVILETF